MIATALTTDDVLKHKETSHRLLVVDTWDGGYGCRTVWGEYLTFTDVDDWELIGRRPSVVGRWCWFGQAESEEAVDG